MAAAAVLDDAPISANEYMGVKSACEYAGVSKQSVFYAMKTGRIHPFHVPGLSYRVFFRSEVIAWRRRWEWRPTRAELDTLIAAGYKAEDFTLDTSSASAAPGGPTGGAVPLVSQADMLAFVRTMFQEGQALTTASASVAGAVAESSMRPWAENVRLGVQPAPDMASVGAIAGEVAQGAMRPITETIRAGIAPISASIAEALQATYTPPASDIERQLSALRVQASMLLNRLLDVMRPIVERLANGGYITAEDTAPFLMFAQELTDALANTPVYDGMRQATAQLPAMFDEVAHNQNDPHGAPHPPTARA